MLGLKLFIKRKLEKVSMKQEAIDKLREMLMAHHTNRWNKIMKIRKPMTRISETELMIARYLKSCFAQEKVNN